jgi:hypothetical protein
MGGGSAKKAWSVATLGLSDVATAGSDAAKASKRAQEDAMAANAKAIADAKLAQESAGEQASSQIAARKRAMSRSRTIFTSPLGLGLTADTARKTLLGQ